MSSGSRVVCVVALAVSASAAAQTVMPPPTATIFPPAVVVPAPLQVERLAPQLPGFVGARDNFESLVEGLAQGLQVTLISETPDGSTEIVTFTPVGGLGPTEIARTLEVARQSLIARGIAEPTPHQLAIALTGGTLPAPAGAVALSGIVPAARGIASATLALPPVSARPNVSDSPFPRGASDSPLPRGVSDSPLPRGISDSPVPGQPGVGVPPPTTTPGAVAGPQVGHGALAAPPPGARQPSAPLFGRQ
jgi:hypothetical protein